MTVRRMLRDDAAQADVRERGWARLPPLDAVALETLRSLARDMTAALVRHALSSDVGYDELWGNPDASVRRETQRLIERALAPVLDRAFVGCRAVLSNLCIKRAQSPRSTIPFHQDFAFVDERKGEVALQLWIPLVDVDPHNGALIVVEGSDRSALAVRPHDARHALKDRPPDDLPPGAVQPRLRAGEGIVFTNRTVHASTPNRSAFERPAACAVLVPDGVLLANWFAGSTGGYELWSIPDEAFRVARPGEIPPGATLLDTVRT